MIRAYFDEGGTHRGSPFTCVAGYLFHHEGDTAFPGQWNAALSTAGLPPGTIFHAADCLVRRQGTPYEGWPLERCEELIASLATVICDTAALGVMSAVSRQAVEETATASPGLFEGLIGSRYALCLMGVLTVLGQRLEDKNQPDAVYYVFEAGDENQRAASAVLDEIALNPELVKRFHYGGHAFEPKGAFPHFQAADLLAWEWQQRHKVAGPTRPPLLRLIRYVPHVHQPYGGPKSIGVQAIVNAFYGLGREGPGKAARFRR